MCHGHRCRPPPGATDRRSHQRYAGLQRVEVRGIEPLASTVRWNSGRIWADVHEPTWLVRAVVETSANSLAPGRTRAKRGLKSSKPGTAWRNAAVGATRGACHHRARGVATSDVDTGRASCEAGHDVDTQLRRSSHDSERNVVVDRHIRSDEEDVAAAMRRIHECREQGRLPKQATGRERPRRCYRRRDELDLVVFDRVAAGAVAALGAEACRSHSGRCCAGIASARCSPRNAWPSGRGSVPLA